MGDAAEVPGGDSLPQTSKELLRTDLHSADCIEERPESVKEKMGDVPESEKPLEEEKKGEEEEEEKKGEEEEEEEESAVAGRKQTPGRSTARPVKKRKRKEQDEDYEDPLEEEDDEEEYTGEGTVKVDEEKAAAKTARGRSSAKARESKRGRRNASKRGEEEASEEEEEEEEEDKETKPDLSEEFENLSRNPSVSLGKRQVKAPKRFWDLDEYEPIPKGARVPSTKRKNPAVAGTGDAEPAGADGTRWVFSLDSL